MQVADRIKKAHISIMQHKKFCAFSGILACGKVTVSDEVPTAATDGWNVIYNPKFVEANMPSEPELRFLVLHEAVHKAYRHMVTWRALHEECAELANIAADHFVNLHLQDTDGGEGFIKMPSRGIHPDPKYRGWSVGMIYNDLKQQTQQGGGGSGSDGSGDKDAGMDEHDWDGNEANGDAAKEQEQANEIQRAIRQGELLRKKLAGKGAGSDNGVFADLMAPKVDWRKLLREFITETCAGRDESSWRKPNRRYLSQDIYMPTMVGTTITRLVVGIDTSGSIWGSPEMDQFAAELKKIIEDVHPTLIDVIYWDTAVAGHQTFEDGQFAVQSLQPKGGGGTDGSVLFDYLRDKQIRPDAIVQLTDGYVGDWGSTDIPTLWGITSQGISAPFGTSVHIEV
jgi:predicted metal-dependent peptidase